MRRRSLYLGILTSCGLLAYACSFPEVQFTDQSDAGSDGLDTGASSSGTTSSSSSSGSTEIIDAGEVIVMIDGATFDANFDAGGKVDASSGDTCCDCDGDGYASEDGGCDAGGFARDCDDFDSRTHPNAGPYSLPPEAPRQGDWNCVNGVEKVPADQFDCSKLASSLLVGGCTAAAGFQGKTECGAKGIYITCKDPLLGLGNCATATAGLATQLCK